MYGAQSKDEALSCGIAGMDLPLGGMFRENLCHIGLGRVPFRLDGHR